MNPAPVLEISGTVHAADFRDVPAYAGRPEVRDPETNRVTQTAHEPRAAYRVLEVVVLTEAGGFAKVLVKEDDLPALEGTLPSPADHVEWPVRAYVGWAGSDYQRFRVVALSLAGDVLAAAKTSGRRASSPAPAGV